jgi:hypothetical protein
MNFYSFLILGLVSVAIALLEGIVLNAFGRFRLPRWVSFRALKVHRIASRAMRPGLLLVLVFYLAVSFCASLIDGARLIGIAALLLCAIVILVARSRLTSEGGLSRFVLPRTGIEFRLKCVRTTMLHLVVITIGMRLLFWLVQ